MKTKRRIRFLGVVALSALLIVGIACGDDDDTSANQDGSDSVGANQDGGDSATPIPTDSSGAAFEGRILFSSNRDGNEEIYVVNVDGTNLMNLTNNPADDSRPTISPDGQRIAFDSDRDRQFRDIYVMNIDGTNVARLTQTEAQTTAFPVWSPDGSKIAYVNSGSGIRVVNSDGTNDIAVDPEGLIDNDGFTWSPDGQKLAIAAADIYVFEVNDQEVTTILKWEDLGKTPRYDIAWAPVGNKIAFDTFYGVETERPNPEVFIIGSDGSSVSPLTDGQSASGTPAWSPFGDRIALSMGNVPVWLDPSGTDIYVIDADGSNATRLTDTPGMDAFPVWSSDGRQIVFVSGRAGELDFYIMNSDGSLQSRITHSIAMTSPPLWVTE